MVSVAAEAISTSHQVASKVAAQGYRRTWQAGRAEGQQVASNQERADQLRAPRGDLKGANQNGAGRARTIHSMAARTPGKLNGIWRAWAGRDGEGGAGGETRGGGGAEWQGTEAEEIARGEQAKVAVTSIRSSLSAGRGRENITDL